MPSKKEKLFTGLKTEKEIEALLKYGSKIMAREFAIYYKRNFLDISRLIIFVPKKLFRRAIDRNKVRRLIKTVFRDQIQKLRGFDIICLARTIKKEDLKLEAIQERLIPLFQKLA